MFHEVPRNLLRNAHDRTLQVVVDMLHAATGFVLNIAKTKRLLL